MDIERINRYDDKRFSKNILNQHGCFLVDGAPYEVEIISESEAIIHGKSLSCFDELIEEFRFYTPHIYLFYDEDKNVIKECAHSEIIEIPLKDIQPSQFYVDIDKVNAIKTFIQKPKDIIIQVIEHNGRYISLDGHTRLYYASTLGFETVRAVFAESNSYIYDFAKEAINRKIESSNDLILLNHEEYNVKWNSYCDDYFSRK